MITHLLCAGLVAFGAAAELPPDPLEVQVIDRRLFRGWLEGTDRMVHVEGTASLYLEVDLETLECGEFYVD